MATCLLQRQRVHERGNYVARLLRVGMSVVVDTRGVALYPCDGVADDRLKKLAVGRPLLAIYSLFLGTSSTLTGRQSQGDNMFRDNQ